MPLTNEEAKHKRTSLIARGKLIYEEKLKPLLEPAHNGEYLAIDPDSGRYFLGLTDVAATKAARQALPDRVFYLMRVGYKTAYTIGGSFVRSKG
jgi:hypothetical protein